MIKMKKTLELVVFLCLMHFSIVPVMVVANQLDEVRWQIISEIWKKEFKIKGFTLREFKQNRKLITEGFNEVNYAKFQVINQDTLLDLFQHNNLPSSFEELEYKLWLDREMLKKWTMSIYAQDLNPKMNILKDIERKGLVTDNVNQRSNLLPGTHAGLLHFIFQGQHNKVIPATYKGALHRFNIEHAIEKDRIIGYQICQMLTRYLEQIMKGLPSAAPFVKRFESFMNTWYASLTALYPQSAPIFIGDSFRPILQLEFLQNQMPVLEYFQNIGLLPGVKALIKPSLGSGIENTNIENGLILKGFSDINDWATHLDTFPKGFHKQLPSNLVDKTQSLILLSENQALSPYVMKFKLFPRKFFISGWPYPMTLVPVQVKPETQGDWVFEVYDHDGEAHNKIIVKDVPSVFNAKLAQDLHGKILKWFQKGYLPWDGPYIVLYRGERIEYRIKLTSKGQWKQVNSKNTPNVSNFCRRNGFCGTIFTSENSNIPSTRNRLAIVSTHALQQLKAYRLWTRAQVALRNLNENQKGKIIIPLLESAREQDNILSLTALNMQSNQRENVFISSDTTFYELKTALSALRNNVRQFPISMHDANFHFDGTYGLTAYYIFQIAYMSSRPMYEDIDLTLRISIEAQKWINTAQLGMDVAQKIEQLSLVTAELYSKRTVSEVTHRIPFSLTKGFALGLPLDLAFLATSGVQYLHSETYYEKQVLGTQFAIAGANVGLQGFAAYLSAIGQVASVQAINILGVPATGLYIGATFLSSAMSLILQRIQRVTQFFRKMKEAYLNRGFRYNPTKHQLEPFSHAIIRKIDFERSKITFGSHYLYRSKKEGISYSIEYDQAQSLNCRKIANLVEDDARIAHLQTAETIILPYSAISYISYSYQWVSPFFSGSEFNGIDVIRKLEATNQFFFTYWSIAHFAIYELFHEYVPTSIEILLNNSTKKLVIPESQGYSSSLNQITYNMIGAGGKYQIILNKGPFVVLSERSNISSIWYLDASLLNTQKYTFNNNILEIKGIQVGINNMDLNRIYLILNDQSVIRLSQILTKVELTELHGLLNYRKLIQYLSAFAEQKGLNENQVFAIPDFEAGYQNVGMAFYIPRKLELVFTQDLDLRLTDSAQFIAYSQRRTCFFNSEKQAIWFTNSENKYTSLLKINDRYINHARLLPVATENKDIYVYLSDRTRTLGINVNYTFAYTSKIELETHINDLVNIISTFSSNMSHPKITLAEFIEIYPPKFHVGQIRKRIWVSLAGWKTISIANKVVTPPIPIDSSLIGIMTSGTLSNFYYFYSPSQKRLYEQVGANEIESLEGARSLSLHNISYARVVQDNAFQTLTVISDGVVYHIQPNSTRVCALHLEWFNSTNNPTVEKLKGLNLFSDRVPILGLKIETSEEPSISALSFYSFRLNRFWMDMTISSSEYDQDTSRPSTYLGTLKFDRYALLYNEERRELWKSKLMTFDQFVEFANIPTQRNISSPKLIQLGFEIDKVWADVDYYHILCTSGVEWVMDNYERTRLIAIHVNATVDRNYVERLLASEDPDDLSTTAIPIYFPNGTIEWYTAKNNSITSTNLNATQLIGSNFNASKGPTGVYVFDSFHQQLLLLKDSAKQVISTGISFFRTGKHLLIAGSADETDFPSLVLESIDALTIASQGTSDKYEISPQMWESVQLIIIENTSIDKYEGEIVLPPTALDFVLENNTLLVIDSIQNTSMMVLNIHSLPSYVTESKYQLNKSPQDVVISLWGPNVKDIYQKPA